MDGLIFQKSLCHIVHVILATRGDEIVSYHRVPKRSLDLNSVIFQYFNIVLRILTNFYNIFTFINILKNVYNS